MGRPAKLLRAGEFRGGDHYSSCRCIRLDELIRVKRAAGRPKDFEAIAELERLLDLIEADEE